MWMMFFEIEMSQQERRLDGIASRTECSFVSLAKTKKDRSVYMMKNMRSRINKACDVLSVMVMCAFIPLAILLSIQSVLKASSPELFHSMLTGCCGLLFTLLGVLSVLEIALRTRD